MSENIFFPVLVAFTHKIYFPPLVIFTLFLLPNFLYLFFFFHYGVQKVINYFSSKLLTSM